MLLAACAAEPADDKVAAPLACNPDLPCDDDFVVPGETLEMVVTHAGEFRVEAACEGAECELAYAPDPSTVYLDTDGFLAMGQAAGELAITATITDEATGEVEVGRVDLSVREPDRMTAHCLFEDGQGAFDLERCDGDRLPAGADLYLGYLLHAGDLIKAYLPEVSASPVPSFAVEDLSVLTGRASPRYVALWRDLPAGTFEVTATHGDLEVTTIITVE